MLQRARPAPPRAMLVLRAAARRLAATRGAWRSPAPFKPPRRRVVGASARGGASKASGLSGPAKAGGKSGKGKDKLVYVCR